MSTEAQKQASLSADIIASMRSLAEAHTKNAARLTAQRRLGAAGWNLSVAKRYLAEAAALEQSIITEGESKHV